MEQREQIVTKLLSCVKECQIRFGVRTELATEFDDRVVKLCHTLECALTHGLKTNTNILDISRKVVKNLVTNTRSSQTPFNKLSRNGAVGGVCLWQFVSLHLSKHELDRYYLLLNVQTDIGRSRSWLRSALNEHSLERYILLFLQDMTLRTQFYEQWALLRDEERNSVLPTIARGLSSILFAINIDNPDLNNISDNQTNGIAIKQTNEPLPVFVASSANSHSYVNRRRAKKVPVSVISLSDEEDSENDTSMYARSAPSTCLSSPNLVLDSKRVELASHSGDDLSESQTNQQIQSENHSINEHLLTPFGTSLVLAIEDNVSDSDKVSNSESNEIENETNKSDNSVQCMANLGNELETTRIEMQCLKTKYEEQIAKLDAQNDSQLKENDILKIQLKKYIAAVQLLKFGQKKDVEDLSLEKLDKCDQHIDYSSSLVYYNEINEYEKKLVQVAEMHGELVEFNDHLHRIINQKEAIIRRLREELIDLRGPFLECNQNSDDNFSIISDFDSSLSLQTAITYPLINIWIPTAFLAGGQKNKSHHVYQIYIRIKEEEWNIYRRYSQFYDLHKSFRKKFPILNTFDFPPKKAIGYKDSKVVQERRKRLEFYLRNLTNLLQSQHQDINNKESLISLLPFLSERMIQREGHSHSDTQLNLPNTSNSVREHHYMGL